MHYPLPLGLAQDLIRLEDYPSWRALLLYLEHREEQLNLSLRNCRPEDSLERKAGILDRYDGAIQEIVNLRGLPDLARSIVEAEAAKAEAEYKRGR